MTEPTRNPITFFNKNLPRSSLELGINLTLDYIRFTHRRYLKARHITRYYGLQNDHETLTIIGWALSYLEKKGLLKRYNKKTWVVTQALLDYLRIPSKTTTYKDQRDIPLNQLSDTSFEYITNQILKAKPIG